MTDTSKCHLKIVERNTVAGSKRSAYVIDTIQLEAGPSNFKIFWRISVRGRLIRRPRAALRCPPMQINAQSRIFNVFITRVGCEERRKALWECFPLFHEIAMNLAATLSEPNIEPRAIIRAFESNAIFNTSL